MLEIKNVYKSYGKTSVLEDVNMSVSEGSIFGLVGINGAGKSTLLRLLSGVMKVDSGEIFIDGEPVYENETAKKKLVFLPDDPFYGTNTTSDGLAELYKTFYNFDGQIYRDYLEKFKLDPKKPIKNFSKGMKRQVYVSLSLAAQPKYLFLDEAFDGLDPLARMVFKRGLIELVEKNGTSVIISSHSLRELEDISDCYGLLDHKTITCSGEIEEDLKKIHKLQMAFENDVEEKDLGFPCLSFTKTGRVVRIIAKGDEEALKEKVRALSPLFVEEIPVDFEEMFACEVQSRGYLE